MKKITTLTAIAALVAGISIASAQNQGGQMGSGASPSNINKGADPSGTAKSGSESGGTAMQSGGASKGGTVLGSRGMSCRSPDIGGARSSREPVESFAAYHGGTAHEPGVGSGGTEATSAALCKWVSRYDANRIRLA